VQELLNSIKEFIETPSNIEDGEVGDKSLGSYLQQIVLLTDSDDDKENMDVVKLMTIHAAKGLEFPVVYL
jgi:DNA helicase-2/ATP-dependent DNA helicase PcrA